MGTTMNSLEKETCKIIVNGVTYTMAQYKKMQKDAAKASAKKSKKRKAKKEVKEVSAISQEIDTIINNMTTLKSFSAFYDHAYKQWGTIANTILGHRKIKTPFIRYRALIRELNGIINDIKKCAKRNESAVFQYVEKLSWKLEDIKTELNNVTNGANESGLMFEHRNHECINGKGKRLGLRVLTTKSYKALVQIEEAIERLNKIAEDGVNPFNYGEHMSFKSRARCWAN